MSQSIEIIQERSVGYDAHGKRAATIRSYIKLNESAEALLGELSGVYLTFFLCVSLHEIAVCSRGAMPYTRADVCRVTRRRDGRATISERAAIYAAKWLVENGFIYECGTRSNGEKMYRPCGTYAWFGDDRGAKFAPLQNAGVQPVAPQGCKMVQDGVQNGASVGGGEGSTIYQDNDLPAPPVAPPRGKRDTARVRAILGACGMYGARADALARRVSVEVATRWERWCRYARANLNYDSPAGIALYRLEADPNAEPPDWQDVEDWERDQDAQCGCGVPQDNDAPQPSVASEESEASAIWQATLDELRLQLPRETFDKWLRPSRAVRLDEDTLVIETHSPYAMEWLSMRLNDLIMRTLVGVAGKHMGVKYV